MVPLLVIVLLLTHFDTGNLTVEGFAPFGAAGVQAAISTGGIIFAYLGLTPIVSVASEVRNPQRTIPFALILSITLSTVIYVMLQLSFLGSIPAEHLADGWSGIATQYSLPYRDIAIALGLGWLAWMVIADAIVSPSGTGNIYMNATPRVLYGWARSGGFFKSMTSVDAKSGIPRKALWASFAMSVFWTMPFPSWEKLIGVVSAALVLSYAVAPVSVAALRRSAPDLPRPFRVRLFSVLGPLSFVIAALIVYWSRWETLSWLLGLQVVMFVAYVLYKSPSVEGRARLVRQVQCSLWLIVFYLSTMLMSYLGTFGGIGAITHPWDTLVVAVIAFFIYEWAARSGLRAAELDLDDDDEQA
jgi:amino acid transporter